MLLSYRLIEYYFVAVGGLFHDFQRGVLNKEKSLSASSVGCRGFLFPSLHLQTAFATRAVNKKPRR